MSAVSGGASSGSWLCNLLPCDRRQLALNGRVKGAHFAAERVAGELMRDTLPGGRGDARAERLISEHSCEGVTERVRLRRRQHGDLVVEHLRVRGQACGQQGSAAVEVGIHFHRRVLPFHPGRYHYGRLSEERTERR